MNWKFTNIHHAFRRRAGISLNEYAYLDIIYQSQVHPKSKTPDGYSTISCKESSDFLGLSKSTICDMSNRLHSIGLIDFDGEDKTKKRTTQLWYNNAYTDDERSVVDAAFDVVDAKNAVRKPNDAVRKPNDAVRKPNDSRSETERYTLVYNKESKKNDKIDRVFDMIEINEKIDTIRPIIRKIVRDEKKFGNDDWKVYFGGSGKMERLTSDIAEDLANSGYEYISDKDLWDEINRKVTGRSVVVKPSVEKKSLDFSKWDNPVTAKGLWSEWKSYLKTEKGVRKPYNSLEFEQKGIDSYGNKFGWSVDVFETAMNDAVEGRWSKMYEPKEKHTANAQFVDTGEKPKTIDDYDLDGLHMLARNFVRIFEEEYREGQKFNVRPFMRLIQPLAIKEGFTLPDGYIEALKMIGIWDDKLSNN